MTSTNTAFSRTFTKPLSPNPTRSALEPSFWHGDYSVGWICALPLELTAAMAMLDGQHPSLPQSLHDDNVYTLGEMGKHNVVIACLPAGQIGNNSAATVASQMRLTFPAIRFGLMVGIGGGAPSCENDIRLGDVVVSRPGKNDGGVIQYDFGRTIAEGRFVRSGTLNAPPAVLLNAVSALQARHNLWGHELAKHLSAFNSPLQKSKYSHQGWENDLLFEASYDHVGNAPTCDQCHRSKLVPRQRRPTDPVIHYGTIASGNQVMKHGASRERWRKESDVLCFEMEAAGLMNNFPCIVIRGICDYADSHKNKRWQEYAAATAAAYAKELLFIVPSSTSPETAADLSASSEAMGRQSSGPEPKQNLFSNIPFQRNLRFSGRKSIIGLIEAHFANCISQQAFILRGMGGIGKTQIALEYAYQCQENGFDVFWVNCSTPQSLFSDFNQIRRMVQAINKKDYEEDRIAVLGWLGKCNDWLLIFDNADDATFPYGDWIPRDKGDASTRRILFTTRDERLTAAIVNVKVEVPLMDDHEAIDLFHAATADVSGPATRSHESVQSLIQRLANLPLAIALASAYLKESPWITVEQYLQQLNSFSDRSKIFNYKRAFSNYNHSIMSTWEISFTKVQKDNPQAADMLILLGFLSNNDVVLGLLKRASANATIGDLHFLRDAAGLEQSLGLLRSLALLSFDGVTISLHPLVHEWIQARLQSDEVVSWGLKALCVVYYAYISYTYPQDGLLLMSDRFMAHTLFALTTIDRHSLPKSSVPEECYLLLLTILVYQGSPKIELPLDRQFPTNKTTTKKVNRSRLKFFSRKKEISRQEDLISSASGTSPFPEPSSPTSLPRLSIVGGQPSNSSYMPVSLAPGRNWKRPVSLDEIHHGHLIISSLAVKMGKKMGPNIAHFAELCTQVTLSLVDLRVWWISHSDNTSLAVVEPAGLAESCLKLESVLSLCDQIPIQGHDLAQFPSQILAVLFIYVSAAAMNIGRSIDFKLEKPIQPFRTRLFQKAYYLCQHLNTASRERLLLDTAVSYARFVDQRSLKTPYNWLPVEMRLAGSIAHVFQNLWLENTSIFFDFLCQSMWESEHEYALFRFCLLIERINHRISAKWSTKLRNRWAELKLTEDNFKSLSDSEESVLSKFLELEEGQRLNMALMMNGHGDTFQNPSD